MYDYVIEKRKFLDLVCIVVNYKKRDFIYSIDKNIFIYTDYKWLFDLLSDVLKMQLSIQ